MLLQHCPFPAHKDQTRKKKKKNLYKYLEKQWALKRKWEKFLAFCHCPEDYYIVYKKIYIKFQTLFCVKCFNRNTFFVISVTASSDSLNISTWRQCFEWLWLTLVTFTWGHYSSKSWLSHILLKTLLILSRQCHNSHNAFFGLTLKNCGINDWLLWVWLIPKWDSKWENPSLRDDDVDDDGMLKRSDSSTSLHWWSGVTSKVSSVSAKSLVVWSRCSSRTLTLFLMVS